MRKNTIKHNKLITIVFVSVLIVIILTSFAHRLYSSYQARRWQENSTFIVFNGDNITIDVFDPHNEEIHTYVLPPDGYVEVPHGYGFYKLSDVKELSVVEGRGEELLSQAVSNTFGIPFDATAGQMKEWDAFMVWYAKVFYENKDETTNLSDAPIFTEEDRIDGQVIKKVDGNKVDKFFKQALWEKSIIDDNLVIGIFNASEEPNIALTIARKLEQIGAHITEIDNSKESVSGCELRVKEDKRNSYTVNRIERLFNCPIAKTSPHPRFDIMLVTASTL